MENSFIAKIKEKCSVFSKGQRRIAHYITEFYDQAAFMTASTLGKSAGVSESTVVRFAVELGYKGYPEMQRAMQSIMLHNLNETQINTSATGLKGRDMVSMVLRADANLLHKTGEILDRKVFTVAVNTILKGKRIYILASNPVSILAEYLKYYLDLMFDDVRLITQTSDCIEKLVRIQMDDVLIAFDFPQYSVMVNQAVRQCRDLGVKIVGITDSELSFLGKNCDCPLIAKSGMLSLLDSLTAPMSIVNALITVLATHREAALTKNLAALEKLRGTFYV